MINAKTELDVSSSAKLFSSLSKTLRKEGNYRKTITVLAFISLITWLGLIIFPFPKDLRIWVAETLETKQGELLAAGFSALVLKIKSIESNNLKRKLLDSLKKQDITQDSLNAKYIDLLTELVKKQTFPE